jgi:hypothetical protein
LQSLEGGSTVDLNQVDRSLNAGKLRAPKTGDICLDRYPRDLRRALSLAEAGQVEEGHAVLLHGLLDAEDLAHAPLQRVYGEALAVYETRYGVAAQ